MSLLDGERARCASGTRFHARQCQKLAKYCGVTLGRLGRPRCLRGQPARHLLPCRCHGERTAERLGLVEIRKSASRLGHGNPTGAARFSFASTSGYIQSLCIDQRITRAAATGSVLGEDALLDKIVDVAQCCIL